MTALEELLWNSCDADATSIYVRLETTDLGGISSITIDDNGDGIEYQVAKQVFSSIGGSPKASMVKTSRGRLLHGKEGRGRYKALALGSLVKWESRVQSLDGSVETFHVAIESGSLARPTLIAPKPAVGLDTGCKVTIHNVTLEAAGLLDPELPIRLATRFASYLQGNPDIHIRVAGQAIDPGDLVERVSKRDVEAFDSEGKAWQARVSVFFWKLPGLSEAFYCRANGVAVEEIKWNRTIQGLSYSLYISSDYFDADSNSGYTLVDELDDVAREFKESARKFLRDAAREALALEARSAMDDLRDQGIYPFEGDAVTPMERAEREVFDVAAIKVLELSPQLREAPNDEKKVKLQVLRAAIEESPSARDRIIGKVFQLGDDDLTDFADLLDKIELSALVSLGRTITDRLEFLDGLHILAYNPSSKRRLRERSQLHKILLRELWLFGEQYSLGKSDSSLRNILKEHLKLLGREDLDWNSDVPDEVRIQDIPDLMLYRTLPTTVPGHFEHLIVELKRPGQKLGYDQFNQVLNYAATVANVGAFDKERTAWKFIVVSSEVDENAFTNLATGTDKPRGRLTSQPHFEVWAYTWGTLIQNGKARMEFLRQSLNYEVDDKKAANYLLKNHGSVLGDSDCDSSILSVIKEVATGGDTLEVS